MSSKNTNEKETILTKTIANAKIARDLARKKVELENIDRRLLPQAYHKIGEIAYRSRIGEKEFPAIYEELDRIQSLIQSRLPVPPKTDESLKEKTARIALETKNKALNQKDSFLANQKLTELGKQLHAQRSSYNHDTLNAGYADIDRIIASRQNVQTVYDDLARKGDAGFRKKMYLAVGLSLAVLLAIPLLWRSEPQKTPSSDVASTHTVSNHDYSDSTVDKQDIQSQDRLNDLSSKTDDEHQNSSPEARENEKNRNPAASKDRHISPTKLKNKEEPVQSGAGQLDEIPSFRGIRAISPDHEYMFSYTPINYTSKTPPAINIIVSVHGL